MRMGTPEGGADAVSVSVIVAAFNPGRFIVEAVESAMAQTRRDIEVIVVDDGSTEDLQGLLADHRDRIKFVRLSHNKGPAAARNAGIEVSTGRYIAVLDADDVWLPHRVQKILDYFDSHPETGFATTDSYLLEGGRATGRSWFATAGTMFQEQDQDVHIFSGNFISGLGVYRRELFDRHGNYDESLRVGEDWDRHIAFLTAGEIAGIVREPLSYYRVHPGNTTSDERRLTLAKMSVLKKWLGRDLRPEARSAAARSLARTGWDLMKMDALSGHRPSLRQALSGVSGAGADIKMKAAILSLFPGMAGKAHRARLRFLAARGGAFSLTEAISSLRERNTRAARRHLEGVLMFGYPLRVRLLAAVWLAFPFGRRRVARKLIEDPFVASLSQPSPQPPRISESRR